MSTKDIIDFHGDLEEGQEGERVFAQYLIKNKYYSISYNNDSAWDVCATSPKTRLNTFFEVKTDVLCKPGKDTGNMAIEIRFKGRPSGISVTEANYFVYLFKFLERDNLHIIDSNKLRDLIRENFHRLKVVKGGDNNNSELVLIPRKTYKDYFFTSTLNYDKTKKELKQEN